MLTIGCDYHPGFQQALANFASAPTGVLVLHVQDVVLHLKGKLVSVAIRTPATIREPLHATLLVAIEDFIAGLTGDSKLAAEFRHRLSRQPPRHTFCYLCLRPLTIWFQWVEPISQTDSTTLHPDSQPIFPKLFTQRFTQLCCLWGIRL